MLVQILLSALLLGILLVLTVKAVAAIHGSEHHRQRH